MTVADKPDIILNSIQRTANTFLSVCFRNAIDLNYPDGYRQFVEDYNFYHHTHSPILLKMPQRDDLFQFTTFRDPEQLMPSLFVFNITMQEGDVGLDEELDDLMDSLINEYIKYVSYALYNDWVNVIWFDDVTTNTHEVLRYMLEYLGISYIRLVDIDGSKKSIEDINSKRYTTEDLYMKNHHLPRDIESTYGYEVAKTVFDRAPKRQMLLDLYSELIKNRAV